MRGLMIAFLPTLRNSMIACVDAAAYGVLLLDLLLCVQMIANPGKTRNSHLIDTRNQNQSYARRWCKHTYVECTFTALLH